MKTDIKTHNMKEVTINAEIHHGEYREQITASAENIVKALEKLGKVNNYCTQTEHLLSQKSSLCLLTGRVLWDG